MLRKFNAKKYNIAKLPRKEEIDSKRCGFTPLPKPAPVVKPIAEVPVVKEKAPKFITSPTKSRKSNQPKFIVN